MRRRRGNAVRRGAALVEMAFVLVIFLMLLFGIMEYGRFLFYRHIMINASRDGARYAAVHTLEDTVDSATTARVKTMMAGMDAKLPNFKIDIYRADANGAKVGAANTAEFGQYVCVELSGDYEPIVPSLLFMSKMTLRAKAAMFSEAN